MTSLVSEDAEFLVNFIELLKINWHTKNEADNYITANFSSTEEAENAKKVMSYFNVNNGVSLKRNGVFLLQYRKFDFLSAIEGLGVEKVQEIYESLPETVSKKAIKILQEDVHELFVTQDTRSCERY